MQRFSQVFNLNKSQAELDFVDIPLDTDIKLFVDPYAISIRKEAWFQECSVLINSFFQELIDCIRTENKSKAKRLLSNLSEPNETHLGHCDNESKGAGVGPKQGNELFKALYISAAVKTGDLKDLSDCALMVEGVGPDKVSDITINIIRNKLALYTKKQCELYNIPVKKCSLNPYWDSESLQWVNDYYELPIYERKPILLCPKIIVRYHIILNDDNFYEHGILNYLQAEHLNAGTALVEALKNGNQRVTKKKLKEQDEYHKSKDFIYKFISKHPEELSKYKEQKENEAYSAISNAKIDNMLGLSYNNPTSILSEKLSKIPSGNDGATSYHRLCIDILNTLFYPDLSMFEKEAEIDEGRKRIDIIAANTSHCGFFFDICMKYQLRAPKIIIECKNYSSDIENPELDQLAGRLGSKRGVFGILLCRQIEDKEVLIKRLRDYVNNDNKYMIVLEDSDLVSLLEYKAQDNEQAIQDFLYSKMGDLIM